MFKGLQNFNNKKEEKESLKKEGVWKFVDWVDPSQVIFKGKYNNQVVELLKKHTEGLRAKKILKHLGVNQGHYSILSRMKKKGIIVNKNHIWTLLIKQPENIIKNKSIKTRCEFNKKQGVKGYI